MPFADVNGQHLYFEDSAGDGPAVVFSHGFLMDHDMFAPQVSALAPEYRCITWDERASARPLPVDRSATGTRPPTASRCSITSGSAPPCWQGCHKVGSCRCGLRSQHRSGCGVSC